MSEPEWAHVSYPKIDFQAISYYSAPKPRPKLASMGEVEPELLRTFEKLGVPTHKRAALANVAVDVIFGSISDAVREHVDLVRKYLHTVVPSDVNYYAALNSAVFTDGSFYFIPKGVKCPMELSTYFRINTKQTGQFERTLIVAEEGGGACGTCPSSISGTLRSIENLLRMIEPSVEVVAA